MVFVALIARALISLGFMSITGFRVQQEEETTQRTS
jgi:hypothetical protein